MAGHVHALQTLTHGRRLVVRARGSAQIRSAFHIYLVEELAVLQGADLLLDSGLENLVARSQQVVVPRVVLIPHFESHIFPGGHVLGTQVHHHGPVRGVVVHNDRRTLGHVFEEHLHVAVGGTGVVSPEAVRPLHRDDDPRHALTGRAAVSVHAGVVVALADAGVPRVALDAGPAAAAAVPPQAFLQDVMADGGAQVLTDGGIDGQ